MSDCIVTDRVFDIVEAETDHTERPGLDAEAWARDLPGSPLVKMRSRWQDAVDVRTFRSVEIKACEAWHTSAETEGVWRLRYPQHSTLRDRGGYYILIVYQPLPSGQSHRRLRIQHAIALTPSAVEAQCGESLTWRYINHNSFGWLRVADIRWPRIMSDSESDVQDLFPLHPASVLRKSDSTN